MNIIIARRFVSKYIYLFIFLPLRTETTLLSYIHQDTHNLRDEKKKSCLKRFSSFLSTCSQCKSVLKKRARKSYKKKENFHFRLNFCVCVWYTPLKNKTFSNKFIQWMVPHSYVSTNNKNHHDDDDEYYGEANFPPIHWQLGCCNTVHTHIVVFFIPIGLPAKIFLVNTLFCTVCFFFCECICDLFTCNAEK